MALIEQSVVDRIEILRDGQIQVRQANEIVDDETGEIKATGYWRDVITPGDDAKADKLLKGTLLDLGDRAKGMKESIWTEKILDEWQKKQEETRE